MRSQAADYAKQVFDSCMQQKGFKKPADIRPIPTCAQAQGKPQGPQSQSCWFMIAVIWFSLAICRANISCL